MVEPVRVFIGTEPSQWLPCEVLRFSILRRTKSEVVIEELEHLAEHLKVPTQTGFSVFRFAIPELCNYSGRAIYLDADIVVLSDIKELFDYPLGEHGALARPRIPGNIEEGYHTSVMPLDCSKLASWKLSEWVDKINKDPELLKKTMYARPGGLPTPDVGPLPEVFNDLDHYSPSTKILHYTTLPAQPWKVPGHPFRHIFLKELKDAVNEGEIPLDAIEREIGWGHVYKGILKDLEEV